MAAGCTATRHSSSANMHGRFIVALVPGNFHTYQNGMGRGIQKWMRAKISKREHFIAVPMPLGHCGPRVLRYSRVLPLFAERSNKTRKSGGVGGGWWNNEVFFLLWQRVHRVEIISIGTYRRMCAHCAALRAKLRSRPPFAGVAKVEIRETGTR